MRHMFFILVTLYSLQSMAAAPVALPNTSFELNVPNARMKLEDITRDPESILTKYVPGGFKVKNKTVNNNQMEFFAYKSVLLISQAVHVKGVLDINPIRSKSAHQSCYNITMDFAGSDNVITDNVESLRMLLCADEIKQNQLKVSINSQLIKGNNFSSLIGPFAIDILGGEMNPIVKAIQNAIQSAR